MPQSHTVKHLLIIQKQRISARQIQTLTV